jgi:hypothetical protein
MAPASGSSLLAPPLKAAPLRRRRWFAVPDRTVLATSLVLQLGLAVLFGHSFDTRVFMGTGYLVAHGLDPYAGHIAFLHHSPFLLGRIGYPPPWPLLLGLLYRASHAIAPDLLLYNFVLKLPVVAATVGLAGMAAATVEDLGLGAAATRKAFAWLLLNPLILFAGAAWGQIDVIAVFAAFAALVVLARGRRDVSAVLLALAVCVKPIALPLLPAALLYVGRRSRRAALRYAALTLVATGVLYVLPFFLFGWTRAPFTEHLNRHFVMAGAMSVATVVRAVRGPVLLTSHWWLLGLLWALALAAAVVVACRSGDGFVGLVRVATAFVLVVFLTRTWLAEPNVVFVLPFALVLTLTGDLRRRLLTALWALPLAFAIFNASPLQLLWVAFPGAMRRSLEAIGPFGDELLIVKAAIVVAWEVVGWWTVVSCLKRRAHQVPAPSGAPVRFPLEVAQ